MVSDREGTNWPAIAYESRPWDLDPHAPVSRTARRRARGPYEAAVPPAIADTELVLPAAVLAQAEDAANELARFDAELGHEIAPFGAILLRTESAASSQIEHLTASARAIAQAELTGHSGRNASLVVANERAMTAALDLSAGITVEGILAMHEALLRRWNPAIAGHWREEQVWIGGQSASPHGAQFVPPHHERVPGLITDLLRFIDRDDLPVFAQAVIAHAQFETVHPFADGNGRTGRALVQAQLRNKRLTRNVTVPVSAGLLADTAAYFAALDAYRSGDVTSIIERFTDAAFAAVANGRALVDALHDIRARWSVEVRARADSNAWRISDLLLRQPVIDARYVAEQLGIRPQNVHRALTPLVDAGVIVEFTDRKRNRMWRADAVLDALDEFATRAGKRR
jgi:Fic family protein